MQNCQIISRPDDPDQTPVVTTEDAVDLEEQQDPDRHDRWWQPTSLSGQRAWKEHVVIRKYGRVSHIVSVVRMTTFFMSVFSEPPRVDLDRRSRITATIVKRTRSVMLHASDNPVGRLVDTY